MKDFSVVKHGGNHECAYQPAENASINDDAFCRYLTLEFNESLVHIVHSILCGMLFPAESSPGEDDSILRDSRDFGKRSQGASPWSDHRSLPPASTQYPHFRF